MLQVENSPRPGCFPYTWQGGELESNLKYVIRAKFTKRAELPNNGMDHGNGVYLGRRGQWCSLEKALTFKTLQAAEDALQEKWNRLRNAGNKGVILSIVALTRRQLST